MSEVTIYWSGDTDNIDGLDWNILFYDIESVYSDLSKNLNKNAMDSNFFMCPSFKSLMKKTFIIKNPISSSFSFDNGKVFSYKNSPIVGEVLRQPSINNNLLLRYGISYFFFSEEEIEMTLTPAYFHQTGYSSYGAVVPGSFNIGSWFRQVNFEYNLWKNSNEISFQEDEPLGYISFNTDKKIVLKRFIMSEKLYKIQNTCGKSSRWEPFVSLQKRYGRFKKSNMKNIVLEEIKNNLVEP